MDDFGNNLVHRCLIGHVEHPSPGVTPGTGDLVDHGLHPLGRQVGDGDLCPLVREQVRGCPAHPTRGTGDEHTLVGDGSTSRCQPRHEQCLSGPLLSVAVQRLREQQQVVDGLQRSTDDEGPPDV